MSSPSSNIPIGFLSFLRFLWDSYRKRGGSVKTSFDPTTSVYIPMSKTALTIKACLWIRGGDAWGSLWSVR